MNKNFLILLVTIFTLVLASLACGSTPRTTTTIYQSTPTVAKSSVTKSAIVPPVASNTPEPRPTATPEPQIKLEMGNYTSYQDSIGSLWFVGEILNEGSASAGSIEVALSLLDDNSNVAAVGSTTLSFIQSNGKFPFKILVDTAPKTWKDVKIQIQGSPSSDTFMPPYVDFKTSNVNGKTSDFGTFELTGTVTNIGQKTATLVNVVAAAYDKDGKIVDVADTFTELTDIAPGNDSPFSIDFLNLAKAPASYELFVVSYTK